MFKKDWRAVFYGMLLFSALIFNPNSFAQAEEEATTRIGISTQMATVKITADYGLSLLDADTGTLLLQTLPGQEVEIIAGPQGVILPVQNITVSKIQAVPNTFPDGENFLKVNNYRYRGNMELFSNSSGKLTIVNIVPVEEYLLGVVSREMSEGYPIEALKAQAVAARNYTLRNKGKHSAEGFDLCSTVDCQAYSGVEREGPKITQAVQETEGEVAVYNGEIITALYFSSSGGYTENAENVWSYPYPYLLGVPDYDQSSSNFQWEVTMTAEEAGQKLKAAGVNIGQLQNLNVTKTGVSGRVALVNVRGTNGVVEMKGEKFRTALGLKSAPRTIRQEQSAPGEYTYTYAQDKKAFVKNGDGQVSGLSLDAGIKVLNGWGEEAELKNYTVKAFGSMPTRFIFAGGGWGHGVGMSQEGAKAMANQGYNYKEILQHYYTGITVEKRY